jgi:methylase of polypeptide subunit release factors
VASSLLPGDSSELRKQRGAFFTPLAIADYLARWGIAGRADARVLDPTCGEGAFLLAGARELNRLGMDGGDVWQRVYGIDVHRSSLFETQRLLSSHGFGGTLQLGDFFDEPSPDQIGARLPWMDAVVGNPPFVRYQEHRGEVRRRSRASALAQGVRISGLASSWAALLVHACGFLKPEGRVAMVLPAELLTVGYAEPIRRWLRRRFASVHLVLFEELQFRDAEAQVVLLVAGGSGGCDAFTLHEVPSADSLETLHPFDATAVSPREEGKWTDLLMPAERRSLFRRLAGSHFSPLSAYGQPELGAVTGSNAFFALSETTRQAYKIPETDLVRIVPPGSRHVPGTRFTPGDWEQLRVDGARVWLLAPRGTSLSAGLSRYIEEGEARGVHEAYKCTIRDPWYRAPVVPVPDLFFTYMSHRYPRLVTNEARATFLNSLHGLVLHDDTAELAREALPLLSLNSLTMLGAELTGRSYGGGILKMEPREAAQLPVPNEGTLRVGWSRVAPKKLQLDAALRAGEWRAVVDEIDDAVLGAAAGVPAKDRLAIREEAVRLRRRRTRREDP